MLIVIFTRKKNEELFQEKNISKGKFLDRYDSDQKIKIRSEKVVFKGKEKNRENEEILKEIATLSKYRKRVETEAYLIKNEMKFQALLSILGYLVLERLKLAFLTGVLGKLVLVGFLFVSQLLLSKLSLELEQLLV